MSEASGAGLTVEELVARRGPATSVPHAREPLAPVVPTVLEATFDELLVPSWRTGQAITRRLERPRTLLSRYSRYALTGDVVVGALAAALAVRVRFHTIPDTYLALPVLLPATWVVINWLYRTYERRYVGSGPDEFVRIARAGLILFASVAAVAYSLNGNFPRTLALMSVPFAVLGSMTVRCLLRAALHRARSTGRGLHRTVVVGRSDAAIALIEQLRHTENSLHHAIVPVGVCLPAAEVTPSHVHDVPVLGTPAEVLDAVSRAGADAVAVVSQPDLSGHALRRLSWALEDRGVELLVSPGIVEVAGPRLSIRPLAGMSLLHLERPVLKGTRRALKVAFDYSATLVLLTLLGPLMLALALAVRLTSRGPALFRQTRVGTDGREFTVYKFRSMVIDAEARLAALATADEGNGVLFKMRHDPRVTRIGRVLRRYSLDELPQLLNVLRGNMSLVGPRPPLPSEVAGYSPTEVRRLRVRPGMTGLWQVSGRSDLTWEESLRLDLRYVDNWSLALDLSILWRTVRAVTQGSGAY
ncbi:sugar transferase [Kineosporia succinea]|uniref:sugar transferase n=1 Tax=Kineosporia succinea TaxID=84632 RepID=UPI0027D84BAD|nr:sugar transferase [Kineosporia succinea]